MPQNGFVPQKKLWREAGVPQGEAGRWAERDGGRRAGMAASLG
jgi:hypothetical protein